MKEKVICSVMGNPYVIVGHDEMLINKNNNNTISNKKDEGKFNLSSWLCGSSTILGGNRGYGTMRYFCSVSFFKFNFLKCFLQRGNE